MNTVAVIKSKDANPLRYDNDKEIITPGDGEIDQIETDLINYKSHYNVDNNNNIQKFNKNLLKINNTYNDKSFDFKEILLTPKTSNRFNDDIKDPNLISLNSVRTIIKKTKEDYQNIEKVKTFIKMEGDNEEPEYPQTSFMIRRNNPSYQRSTKKFFTMNFANPEQVEPQSNVVNFTDNHSQLNNSYGQIRVQTPDIKGRTSTVNNKLYQQVDNIHIRLIDCSENPNKSFDQIQNSEPINNKNNNQNENNDKIFTFPKKESDIIELPNDFTTDDPDLKQLIDILNEDPNNKPWKDVFKNNEVKTFKKKIKGIASILLKTVSTINYPYDAVYQAISNIDIRMKWDDVFNAFRVIDKDQETGQEVLYMSMKAPALIKDRDWVQRRKKWENFPTHTAHMLHFKSIDHPKAPLSPKHVRAHTYISGYYITQCKDDPNKTFIAIISQTDVRGAIPKWIVNNASSTKPKQWIDKLKKGCEMVLKDQKNK